MTPSSSCWTTVFRSLDGALWGATNRPRQDVYPSVFEALIAAGAIVQPGFADWWERQEARAPEAHARILELLRANEGRRA